MNIRHNNHVPVILPRMYCRLNTGLERNNTWLPSSWSLLKIFIDSRMTIKNMPDAMTWKTIFETCQAIVTLFNGLPLTI